MPTNPTPGLNPGVPEPQFAAWRNFMRAYGVVFAAQRDELASSIGMQMSWYEVLLVLNEVGDDGMDISALQSLTVYSQSGLSQLLTRMSVDGLVERRSDPDDGRKGIVAITDDGIEELRRAAPIHARGIIDHFANHLDDDEARIIAKALQRIIDAGRSN